MSTARKKTFKERMYEIVFESDTPAGRFFDLALLCMIVASVLVIIFESVPAFQKKFATFFITAEWIFTGLFTAEYLARIYTVPNKLRYMRSFFGIVDLLSILPFYASLLYPAARSLMVIRSIRFLRIFRILKLTQFVGEAQNLKTALAASRHKITVFLFTVITSVIIMGAIMFLVEGPEHGFTSIPTAIYWSIVTMTTVGFGDITPKTELGQMFASVLMILGYGVIAVPTGIVSSELINIKRREMLSTQVCPHCMREGHDSDAAYCKYCGGLLNP